MTPDQPTKGDELLAACPFCGGDAEMDTRQGYANFSTGRTETGIAIYCRVCGVQHMICRGDVPDVEPEHVIELWNRRTPPTALKDREGVEGLRAAVLATAKNLRSPLFHRSGHFQVQEGSGTAAEVLDRCGEILALIQPGAGSGGKMVERYLYENAVFARNQYAKRLKGAEAEVERLRAALTHAEHMLSLRNKQMETTRRFWIRDAEEAIAGDLRAIRNRVEMAKMGPVEIVQSDDRAALSSDSEGD